jgi:TPR repeat protein
VDQATIAKWRRLSGMDDREAMNNLGLAYRNGQCVPKDKVQAVYWFRQAADKGHPGAMGNLALAFFDGEGVIQDKEKAFQLWKKSFQKGDTAATFSLGFAYFYGHGTRVNKREAIKLWSKASRDGDAYAQYHLGKALTLGDGVAKDDERGVRLMRLASEEGVVEAFYQLGETYKAQGRLHNPAKALENFRKGCFFHHPPSFVRYGAALLYGDGLPKDVSKATLYFMKAAELGDHDAEYYLGLVHFRNRRYAKKIDQAKEYWLKAAAAGNAKAAVALKSLEDTDFEFLESLTHRI